MSTAGTTTDTRFDVAFTRSLMSLRRSLASMWMTYLDWRARRGTRKLLHALDDRTLRDIGLRRSHIDTVATDLRWRPPHRLLGPSI
ncbi:MAG TPA: DUF1127 domain-containing protein [Vineibacter sp.]|nr:DUF1127 domain-containing protein [Vineibacter sp.]